jgi:hypothetical protein
MQIWVESDLSADGRLMPRRVWFDGRHVDVEEMLDQWHGANYRYVKVRGDGGALYILRFDEIRTVWELTMFESAEAQGL